MRFLNRFRKIKWLIPSKYKVAYIGSVHNNLGDIILYDAHKKLFPKYKLVEISPSDIISQFENKFNASFFGKVILGGGTFIYRSPDKLNLVKHYLSLPNVNVFCIGTGLANPEFWKSQNKLLNDGKITEYKDISKEWISALREFSFVGVRGPLSANILQNDGLQNIVIVGDAAIILAKDKYVKKKQLNKIVGLNFGFSSGLIWGGEENCIDTIRLIIDNLLKKGFRIKLLPVADGDLEVNNEIVNYFNNNNIELLNYITDFEGYYSTIEECDFFIGEKLHSVITACMTRTPSIMLEYRPKCRDFMCSVELEKYNFRIDRFKISDMDNLTNLNITQINELQKFIDKKIKILKRKLEEKASIIESKFRC